MSRRTQYKKLMENIDPVENADQNTGQNFRISKDFNDAHVIGESRSLAATPVKMGCFRLSALSVVGKIANIIRLIFAIGLASSAIITLLMALNVFVQIFVTTRLLYACFIVELVAVLLILFDTATAQWIVEKLIVQLSADIKQFEVDLGRLEVDLKTSQQQIEARDQQLQIGKGQLEETQQQLDTRNKQLFEADKQLEESASQISARDEQIRKQEEIIEKTMTVQANMRDLLTSLLSAQSEGENINDLFTKNLDKFELLLNRLSGTTFAELDTNHDNVIDPGEFKIYTSREIKARSAILKSMKEGKLPDLI